MITNKASGKVTLEVAERMTAEESAVLLFLGWIQHNGLMRTLTADQGSPFTAKVFEVIRKVFGVKVHNFTSQGD